MLLTPAQTQPRRCAIYTRRSVGFPLDQQFTSLEAQRVICSSYIASQEPNGWLELPKRFDDEGHSGGTLVRPALQELLADIEGGMVDVVVAYKLDRITRTLLDFVRLMDLFQQYGVSFVAVTQNFNTGDSTGRLIQNVLLTFAQFEREIASDRLRDKFHAMRERGLFIGGHPPFGYELEHKKLVIDQGEAEIVRWMFGRYLEVASYTKIAQELAAMHVVRRSRISKRGHHVHGRKICQSSVWNMLGNPVYVGEVRSHGKTYPGVHEAIISRSLWDNVQALRAKRTRAKVVEIYRTDLLRNLMYDSFGRKMGVFRDRRYSQVRRYYISNQSEWGRRHGARRYRAKADDLEKLVVAAVAGMLGDRERVRAMLLRLSIHDSRLNKLAAAGPRIGQMLERAQVKQVQCVLKALIERIELSSTLIKIVVRTPELPRILTWDGVGFFRGDMEASERSRLTDVIDVPANTICMKRELTSLLRRKKVGCQATPNRRLVGLLRKARAAQQLLDERRVFQVVELAARIGCHAKRFTGLVRLNYLAPDIVAAILDGTQPPELTCTKLTGANLPMDWALQRRLLGFPDQPDFLRSAPGW